MNGHTVRKYLILPKITNRVVRYNWDGSMLRIALVRRNGSLDSFAFHTRCLTPEQIYAITWAYVNRSNTLDRLITDGHAATRTEAAAIIVIRCAALRHAANLQGGISVVIKEGRAQGYVREGDPTCRLNRI